MLKVGLTGGVASGKSSVAAEFARLGIPIADADVIARELTAPGQVGLVTLQGILGTGILDAAGALERGRLRQRLFADAGLRKQVEAALHPLILAELTRQLNNTEAAYCVAVVPLLVETPDARALVDRVLVVDCSEPRQLARLMSRDGESEAGARAMLAAQASRSQRLAAGDDILVNDEDGLARLQAAALRLHAFYLELAAQRDYRRAGLRLP